MLSRIQERTTIAEHSEIEVSNEYSSNIVDNKIIENTQIIEGSNVDDDSETKISEIPNNVSTPQSDSDEINPIIKYIEDNYASKQLHEPFIFEYYPYNYDPEFWYDFLQNDMSSVTDYRFVELSIIKRVVELNNSKMDKWFGITNTRLQNIFNIERDFVVQYYALGIIGTLLVFAPYFVLLGKNKFKNLNILNLSAFITILFLFCTAYITGNLLNSLSFTLYFSFCFYLLTK